MTGQTPMEQQTPAALRRQRQALLRRLPPLEAILRGSLIERYKRCGKPGCHCASGRGHGPKYYLSVSQAQRSPTMEYVPQKDHEQVSQYLANYQAIRAILEQICQINSELLRRREPL